MATPNTKQEFADFILRRLGAPVINIEISDEQLEDVIDDSLQMFREYHFDGTDKVYRTVSISADILAGNNRKSIEIGNTSDYVNTAAYIAKAKVYYEGRVYIAITGIAAPVAYVSSNSFAIGDRVIHNGKVFSALRAGALTTPVAGINWKDVSTPALDTNGWQLESKLLEDNNYTLTDSGQVGIRIPENIIAVTKAFRFDAFAASGIYSYDYQFFLNNFDFFYGAAGGGGGALTSYYIQRTYIEFIEHMINPQPSIRFSKHRNRLYLDIDWNRTERAAVGQGNTNFLLECYEVSDPEVFGDVYNDSWLKRYAVALAKKQWGSNLKKYEGTQLPGGVTVNGQVMYDEGNTDAATLEEELKQTMQLEMDGILIG